MPHRRKLTAEDLLRLRIPTGVAIAPDGASIVYAIKEADARRNRYASRLHRVAVRGGRPRQLTRGDGLDGGPVFSPTGRQIAFVSRRGEENPQIWVLPAHGGEARQLTHLLGGPVRRIQW